MMITEDELVELEKAIEDKKHWIPDRLYVLAMKAIKTIKHELYITTN